MKRKTMTLVLCLLAALALVSVGFASWVISAGDSKKADGNITVDTVEDKRLKIDVAWVDGSTIKYGAPTNKELEGTTITNPWLTNDSDDKSVLTVSLKVTLSYKNATTAYANGGATVSATIKEADDSSAYKTAKEAGYVGDMPTAVCDEQEDGTWLVKFTFTWGSKFGNKNPYIYYNDGTKTAASDGDAALAALQEVYKVNNAKFKVTVTATPKANA